MRRKGWSGAILLIGLVLCAGDLRAQVFLSPEHERIAFLAGEWRTTSEFPDGTVVEGDLTYRWVMGGAWMQVEFRGEPPDGSLWEAHVMQRWNPAEEEYEAWSFPEEGDPIRYRGASPESGFFRIERTDPEGTTSGIDYREREDGSVHQENWILENGERRVTLRTTYEAAGGG